MRVLDARCAMHMPCHMALCWVSLFLSCCAMSSPNPWSHPSPHTHTHAHAHAHAHPHAHTHATSHLRLLTRGHRAQLHVMTRRIPSPIRVRTRRKTVTATATAAAHDITADTSHDITSQHDRTQDDTFPINTASHVDVQLDVTRHTHDMAHDGAGVSLTDASDTVHGRSNTTATTATATSTPATLTSISPSSTTLTAAAAAAATTAPSSASDTSSISTLATATATATATSAAARPGSTIASYIHRFRTQPPRQPEMRNIQVRMRCDAMRCHVMSRDVMQCHVMPCRVMC